MLTYLLDTNIISYLADPASEFHQRVHAATRRLPSQSQVAVPLLTLYELAYGFRRDRGHGRMVALVRDSRIEVLVPSEAGAEVFAELKDAYRLHTGARKHELARHNVDFIVASTAIVEGAVLISNDGIFRTLAGLDRRLVLENWAEAT